MPTRERERESSSASQSIKTKNAKQGGFVGLELGLGIANVNYIQIDNTTGETYQSYKKTYPHFPINFQFGYQWYFTQTMGLRLKGYVGYSNYFKELLNESRTDTDTGYYYGDTGYVISQDFTSTRDNKVVMNLDSHAIQYGAELAYIWDFLEKGKHTLGLDVAPIGLEVSTYFPKFKYKTSGSATYTWSGTGANDTGLPDTFTESNDRSASASFETHTKLAYSASIGLHYYYNVNHQMFLSYKLRTYSTTPTAKMKNDDSTDTTKISNVANHAMLLGYAYKF